VRGYHLEFSCRTDEAARLVSELIARLGGDAGITRRRGHALIYVKDAQTISTMLANMGAAHALLRLEEQRAVRQTKNAIRRTVNSEAANAERAAASAARQRDAARRVLANPGTTLTGAVREAARLRIAHPTRTLRELATLSRPPISKAAMANRMRLLERLAKR
jgi:cell division protein WhiA